MPPEGGNMRKIIATAAFFIMVPAMVSAAFTTGFLNGLACDWNLETAFLSVLFSLSRVNIWGFVSVWRYVSDDRR